jgi:hypothetical protein
MTNVNESHARLIRVNTVKEKVKYNNIIIKNGATIMFNLMQINTFTINR